jgi:hypothetical protein
MVNDEWSTSDSSYSPLTMTIDNKKTEWQN